MPDPTAEARAVAETLVAEWYCEHVAVIPSALLRELDREIARALDAFAAEAVAREREAILALAEGDGFLADGEESALAWIAAAIRARGSHDSI